LVAVRTDRGVEYEFRLSALNSVDYGDVTTRTIRTPDGSESQSRDHVTCHQDGHHITLGHELLPAAEEHNEISVSGVALFPLFPAP